MRVGEATDRLCIILRSICEYDFFFNTLHRHTWYSSARQHFRICKLRNCCCGSNFARNIRKKAIITHWNCYRKHPASGRFLCHIFSGWKMAHLLYSSGPLVRNSNLGVVLVPYRASQFKYNFLWSVSYWSEWKKSQFLVVSNFLPRWCLTCPLACQVTPC